MCATVVSAVEGSTGAPGVNPGGGGGAMAVAGSDCGFSESRYTSTRFGYAKNGETVTYVLGEQWCWDPQVGGCPTNYTVTYAREFRYDGARARYMNAPLDLATMAPYNTTEKPTVWSDYDGDEIYGDYTVASASPWTVTNVNSYEAGVWRKLGSVADYLHNDHLGTLRLTTGSTGSPGAFRVFTAFGERLPGSATDRFGYVGAYGYQSTLDGGAEVFPYLHVGARYYDPSSGRFLQRDPIGIRGGVNVYAYLRSGPTNRIDPSGLVDQNWEPPMPELPRRGDPSRPQSPEDIAEELRQERWKQLLVCTAIPVAALPNMIASIVAIAVDAAVGVYIINDPIITPSSPPPKPSAPAG
ncbi:MAG: RHS repeat-associated core domain-containing protein [Planctomycetota bacterium]